jgi:UDP-glucose:(heptosyl)LPS alpha-1,3-glucosyltransferase
MKLAFCLFNYFPFGGLQRDFLRIAKESVRRGHTVDVYTMSWQGDLDPDFSIHILPTKGWQNHTRCRHFAKQLTKILIESGQQYDLIVGFNKLPGLDIYYAADICYQAKMHTRSFWHKLTSRYRQRINDETAVFAKQNRTQILLIAHQQKEEFQKHYQTSDSRFHLLPPGIDKSRMAPDNAIEIRQQKRKEWNINSNDLLLLLIGSGFKTKGLDRALLAIAALPEEIKNRTQLFIIGQDHTEHFQKQAQQYNIVQQVKFLGGRHDVAEFLLAADLLLHPAYHENTGTVLLEALAAGLPVLTTAVCGYAHYIEESRAGIVFPSPFQQNDFNQKLAEILTANQARLQWQQNALNYTKTADIYSMPQRAVDCLEAFLPVLDCSHDQVKFNYHMQLQGKIFRQVKDRSTQEITLAEKKYFIKQHTGVGWKEIFKNLLQGRLPILSAKNEWQAITYLNSLNVSVPKIIAYGCQGLNPATKKSFLVTEALSNTISLEDLCIKWIKNRPKLHFKRALIDKVATIARLLHDNGVNHRDFYLCHFLLDLQDDSCLYLIDLHRAQIRKSLPLRWRIKDLAGLYFSAKDIGLTSRDLLRFIKTYRAKSLSTILRDEARLWEKIKQHGNELYQKHA